MSTSRAFRFLATVVLCAASAWPAVAGAQCPGICAADRQSVYFLSFADNNLFSDAAARYAVGFDLTPSATGSSATASFGLKNGWRDFFAGSIGAAGIAYTPIASSATTITYSKTGAGYGSATFGYFTDIATNFGDSWIRAGVHNGRHTLDFIGGGGGGLELPHPYSLVVQMYGDWSSSGIGMGQHEFLGWSGAGYSLDYDFAYDGGSDITTLKLSNPSWDGANPSASFRLYGAEVVPEPASVALVATGLIGMGLVGRRRLR